MCSHTTVLPVPWAVRMFPLLSLHRAQQGSIWLTVQPRLHLQNSTNGGRSWRKGNRNKEIVMSRVWGAQCKDLDWEKSAANGDEKHGTGVRRNLLQRKQNFSDLKPPHPTRGRRCSSRQQSYWIQWDWESEHSCWPWAFLELFIISNAP